jgi:DNA primase
MFPLFDTNNRVVGFSGRIYNTTDGSKYINTKETPIFKKGELLYNYYNAKEHCRLKKNVILVEGFMDVIRLHTIDVKNTVALMGTALTKNQINLIKRLSTEIYLCLDGDGPGIKANLSVGEDLVNSGCNVKVINLSDGYDPDEFVLKYGKDEFLSLYNNAVNYSEYKLYHMRDGFDLSNIDDRSTYIKSVLGDIGKETDEIKREFLLKKISNEFDIDISILKNNLKNEKNYSKIETLQKEPKKSIKLDKYTKATYGILYAMMNSYEHSKKYEKNLNYLPTKEARLLANEIIYAYRYNDSLVLADFLTNLSTNEELFGLVREIMKVVDDESNFASFEDYVAVIKEYSKNQEVKRLKEMIKEEIDPVKKAELLEKIRLVKMESEG